MYNVDNHQNRAKASWALPLFLIILCSPITIAGARLDQWFSEIGWPLVGHIAHLGSWLLLGVIGFGFPAWSDEQTRRTEQEWVLYKQEAEQSKISLTLSRNEDPGPYFVYLRAFSSDMLSCDFYHSDPYKTDPRYMSTAIDDELMFSLEPIGPLLCLGDKDTKMRFGAATIATNDSDWRGVVRPLMARCSGVIAFPWPSDGILEEIEYIYQHSDIWAKTVVIMPPQRGSTVIPLIWQEARENLARKGIQIPQYNYLGMLLSPSTGMNMQIAGHITDRTHLRSAIIHLLGRERSAQDIDA